MKEKVNFSGLLPHRGKLSIKDYQARTGGTHKEIFIGETASVIYSPVYCSHGRIYDAVLKKPLDLQTKDLEVEQSLISAPDEKWHVDFLPCFVRIAERICPVKKTL
ncbi:MAG: hypothetical protein MZU95_17415 [Desulfomicrobium escambiense]|nr:hypothetical protein [Desulfomicrobium escambiense]